jgi:hypothetical protein
MVSTSQQVGAAVGLAALLGVSGAGAGVGSLMTASWVGGVAAIAAAFVALALPRR